MPRLAASSVVSTTLSRVPVEIAGDSATTRTKRPFCMQGRMVCTLLVISGSAIIFVMPSLAFYQKVWISSCTALQPQQHCIFRMTETAVTERSETHRIGKDENGGGDQNTCPPHSSFPKSCVSDRSVAAVSVIRKIKCCCGCSAVHDEIHPFW
jgi:hypothetical protein